MSFYDKKELGEGKITKCFQRYAFIEDERLGGVYVSLESAQSFMPDCKDLREKYKVGGWLGSHRSTRRAKGPQ